ncbi:MAG: addiction module protein [Gemmataceae bacterium]
MSLKDAVIEMIRSLPDEATWADIAEAGDARFGEPDDENLTREEWEAAWVAECDRRLADLRSGRTVGIPAEEVMRKMREKYG